MDSGGGREPSRPLTVEEEALKRSTDCVYFLASPLTCKKGSECEYRHSEGARFNPRDCWYWLKGNCLNPKCCFRHPPLDWLFGEHGAGGAAAAEPLPSSGLSTTVQVAHGPAAYCINKQNVPCYFFLKGHCLNGDRCPFMHGQQPASTNIPQQVSVVPASPSDLPSAITGDKCILKEFTYQQRISRASAAKAVEILSSPGKPVIQAENVSNNGFVLEQSASPHPLEDELSMFESINFPISSGNRLSQPRSHQSWSIDEHLQNGKEADEFLGESSPGFDVLVDDHMEDSDYYQNVDEHAGAPVRGERNLNFVNDFNYLHPEYEPVPRLETDQYNGIEEYDMSKSFHGLERCRASFERVLDIPSMLEKRMFREESYDELDCSDLRHRLLKLRRLNGSGSDSNPDRHGNHSQRNYRYIQKDRSHTWRFPRDHRPITRERSISTRLKGRITLPARSSPDRPNVLRSEMGTDGERYQSRLSQARLMNDRGRCHERRKRRLHDDLSSSAGKSGGQPILKDDTDPLDFAGPKSLAELKGAKVSESSQGQKSSSTRKALDHQESEASHSFEGPKPPSVILKRKRETAPGNSAILSSGERNDQRDADGYVHCPASVVFLGSHHQHSSKAEDGGNIPEASKVTTVDEEEEEGVIATEGEELPNGQLVKVSTHEVGDEMMVNGMDDQQLDDYGRRGESDYEAANGEDDNAYQEDDEDDFAKKVGVMLS